uniref:hypothetical protein n=1 Tax=Aporhodopirellula aestuarii TaxID=2950107 RepID=UPI0038990EB9
MPSGNDAEEPITVPVFVGAIKDVLMVRIHGGRNGMIHHTPPAASHILAIFVPSW